MQDSTVLQQARAILTDRFNSGKYDDVASQVREAQTALISRARHPSRQPQGPTGVVPDLEVAFREPQD